MRQDGIAPFRPWFRPAGSLWEPGRTSAVCAGEVPERRMGKAARPRHPTNPSLLSHAGGYYADKPGVAPVAYQRLQSRTDVR